MTQLGTPFGTMHLQVSSRAMVARFEQKRPLEIRI